MTIPRHGGGLRAAAAHYSIPLADWLDLSTGINPRSYPISPGDPVDWTRLPDPQSLAALTEAARCAYRVGAQLEIVPAPGTDLALRLLPLIAPEGAVDILAPTYSGHEEGWRNAGRTVGRIAEIDAGGAPILVLANPNNPDGRTVDPLQLLRTARLLAAKGGLLVVDEAFADLDPSLSLLPIIGDEPVVVLRSFGKFFGLAGLRLGFVIGAPAPCTRLRALLGDWPVSGPAITAGIAALRDTAWQDATRIALAADRQRLADLLEPAGLRVIGGTDLFLLARSARAQEIHMRLAKRGIWTRIFAEDQSLIRFGMPPECAFDRLEEALRKRGR
ncbi:cobalamin biosynthetic protein CobC [Kaistia dalseonensis]|uniref:threonine-phosphate decarboxylase n=1 Tax=Kaistia dalseonensis TaxID=410840 RepID=A0ABU0H271_9HYPH|nr:cobalamin biosynthetic protein CobC [Kaistia dalseonensis]